MLASSGVNVFNSLGSNYTSVFAVRALFATGNEEAHRKLTAYLEKRYGGYATLTYKGRDALSIGLRAIIGDTPRAKVVINSFTCIALYDAVVENGFVPLFLDIEEGALNFSAVALARALDTEQSIRAVIIQNTLGTPAEVEKISLLCKERGIALIEDLAHSIGATYENGAEAGTVGDAVVLSFSQDKVVDGISGGALIMRNADFASRVDAPKGRVPLFRQLRDRFYPIITWNIRVLYSLGIGKALHTFARALHLLPRPLDGERELCVLPSWYAPLILGEFMRLETTALHRRTIATLYAQKLEKSSQIPRAVEKLRQSANLRFPIQTADRAALVARLARAGIHISDIWYDAPIAPKKYAARTSYTTGMCPRSDSLAEIIVNLPTHINISLSQAEKIADEVNSYLNHEAQC